LFMQWASKVNQSHTGIKDNPRFPGIFIFP